MAKTTVNLSANQFRTTVPKGVAEAFDLDGKKLEWSVKNGTTLEVKISDE